MKFNFGTRFRSSALSLSFAVLIPFTARAARMSDHDAQKLYLSMPQAPVLNSSQQMLVKETSHLRCQVGAAGGGLDGWYVCEVKDGGFTGAEADLVFDAIDSTVCKNNSPTFHVDQQMMIKCERSAGANSTSCEAETHASGYEGVSRGYFCREY